jgi:phospholipid-transporting ATPase
MAKFICEEPNSMIYQFKGKVVLGEEVVPVAAENFLLRSSSLRNTDFIIGVVVYTGHESKIMLNSAKASNKFSHLESRMNDEIIKIFLVQVFLCLFCATCYLIWFHDAEDDTEEYLELDELDQQGILLFVLMFFSWMLIFTNFVPISLIVTLEVVKFIQAIFIAWDLKLYYEPSDIPARVNSSNLNEELGQVTHVFSDKTGTLTCNKMEFRKMTIKDVSYGSDSRMIQEKVENVDFVDGSFDGKSEENLEFLLALSLCHTVMTENSEQGRGYKASSTDELALVSAAKYFGVELVSRSADEIVIDLHGLRQVFQTLKIIEFTSNRKRMTVIVKRPDGQIWLYCKGADSKIIPILKSGIDYLVSCEQALESYACQGLRTLVLACKQLTVEEYEEWQMVYQNAMENILNREYEMEKAADSIEKDLDLIGVTGIEDKLQNSVPETIEFIRKAGVKIWMITGDKIETAVNVAFACKLLTNKIGRVTIDKLTSDEVKNQLEEAVENHPTKMALIISGDSLLHILQSPNELSLATLMASAHVIIACRVSPQQKADLVRLTKEKEPNSRTLSIGDGANDVNMILAAHVGIGIAGLEGNQAVWASDYAIGQFSYLKRLMFLHGHESYRKNANLICYNFYKNILVTFPLMFYGIFSAFSGQILYNMWSYQLFNVSFASMPIMIYAIFDKDKNFGLLEDNPAFYKLGIKGKLFTSYFFWRWIFIAVFEGFVILVVSAYSICYYSTEEDGKIMGMWELSDFVFTTVVIIVNLRVFSFSMSWYWFSMLISFLSIGLYFVNDLMITQWFPIKNFFDNFDGRGSTLKLLRTPLIYFIGILVIFSILIIQPLFEYTKKLKKLLLPKDKYQESSVQTSNLKSEEHSSNNSESDEENIQAPLLRRHTGFGFNGEPGQTPQITDPRFGQD